MVLTSNRSLREYWLLAMTSAKAFVVGGLAVDVSLLQLLLDCDAMPAIAGDVNAGEELALWTIGLQQLDILLLCALLDMDYGKFSARVLEHLESPAPWSTAHQSAVQTCSPVHAHFPVQWRTKARTHVQTTLDGLCHKLEASSDLGQQCGSSTGLLRAPAAVHAMY